MAAERHDDVCENSHSVPSPCSREQQERDDLVALGRTMGRFAHDLRGPLGVIRQVVDVLKLSEDIGMTPQELYAMLDESVRDINRLIDDCLEYSQGVSEVKIVRGTWAELLGQEIDAVRQEIGETGVEVVTPVRGRSRSCRP